MARTGHWIRDLFKSQLLLRKVSPMRTKNNLIVAPYLAVVLMFLLIVTSAVVYRGILLQSTPIDPFRADMLPNILAGFKDLDAGESPYRPHVLPNTTIPHYYLPALWAGFYPFYKLGLDIRWFTIVCQVAIVSLLAWVFLKVSNQKISVVSWLLFFVLLLSYLFSKLVVTQVLDIHTGAVGLYLVILFHFLRQNNIYSAAIAAAALVLSREPAILLVAPVLLAIDKKKRIAFVALFLVLVISVIYLAFSDGRLFSGLFHYNRIQSLVSRKQALAFYGLNGVLLKEGLSPLRVPLQLFTTLWPWILVFGRKKILPLEALAMGGASYCGFMLFAAVTFEYVFIEPILLAMALVLAEPAEIRNN